MPMVADLDVAEIARQGAKKPVCMIVRVLALLDVLMAACFLAKKFVGIHVAGLVKEHVVVVDIVVVNLVQMLAAPVAVTVVWEQLVYFKHG